MLTFKLNKHLFFNTLLGVFLLSCGQSVPSPSLAPSISGGVIQLKAKYTDHLLGIEPPKVATDCEGNFIVAWSESNPLSQVNDIYVQKYDYTGRAQGTPILVDAGIYYPDTQAEITLTEPNISMNCRGDFVVAWKQIQTWRGFHPNKNNQYDIYFTQYNYKNQKFSLKKQATISEVGERSIFEAKTAINNQGDAMLAWVALDDGKIYGQYYPQNGLIHKEFIVNTLDLEAPGTKMVLAANQKDEFLISWSSNSGAYIQHYIQSQAKHTPELKLKLPNPVINREGQILSSPSGDFLINWHINGQAYLQTYRREGYLQEPGKVVAGQHFTLDHKGDVIGVWEADMNVQLDPDSFTINEDALKRIYLQVYNSELEADGEPIIFKELAFFYEPARPLIAIDKNNRAIIFWTQREVGEQQKEGVYMQSHFFEADKS